MFGAKASPSVPKIVKRVRKMPTEDLKSWADQVSLDLHLTCRKWQTSGEDYLLDEAVLAAEAVREMLLEIQRRNRPLV